MKLTHKLCGAALVAAVGIVAAFPSGTKADGNSLTGGAEVEFTSMSTTQTAPTNYSGSGDGPLPTESGATTTDAKGFGISYLTNLNFGQQNSVLTADGNYWVKPFDNNTVANSHLVHFEDLRTTATHEYQVTATLSKQFTTQVGGVDKELNGAKITYLSVGHRTQGPDQPYVALDDAAVVSQIELEKDATVPVVTNKNTAGAALYEKGYGKQALYFGEYAVKGVDDLDENIKLTVPRADNPIIQGGKYTAEITWAMSDTFIP